MKPTPPSTKNPNSVASAVGDWGLGTAFAEDAGRGDAAAYFNLGMNYFEGTRGLPQNPKEAVRLFQLSAGMLNSNGQNILGFCYAKGIGGGFLKTQKKR